MEKKRRKKSDSFWLYLPKFELIILFLILLAVVGLTYVTGSVRLLEFRSTTLYRIGSRVLYSGIIAYFALLHSSSRKLPPLGKAVMLLGMVNPWLPLLPTGAYLVAHVVLLFVQAALVTLYATQALLAAGPGLVFTLSILNLFADLNFVTFVNDADASHFWPVGLALGLLACGGIGILLFRNRIHLKDNRTSEKVALLFLVLLFGFFAGTISASNLNCGLDTSIPVTRNGIVVDHRVSSGKSSSYYLTLEVFDSEVEFEVAHDDYLSFNIGDRGIVERYEGAFGDPYYLLTSLEPAG